MTEQGSRVAAFAFKRAMQVSSAFSLPRSIHLGSRSRVPVAYSVSVLLKGMLKSYGNFNMKISTPRKLLIS
jgi:hypothetical protein